MRRRRVRGSDSGGQPERCSAGLLLCLAFPVSFFEILVYVPCLTRILMLRVWFMRVLGRNYYICLGNRIYQVVELATIALHCYPLRHLMELAWNRIGLERAKCNEL